MFVGGFIFERFEKFFRYGFSHFDMILIYQPGVVNLTHSTTIGKMHHVMILCMYDPFAIRHHSYKYVLYAEEDIWPPLYS